MAEHRQIDTFDRTTSFTRRRIAALLALVFFWSSARQATAGDISYYQLYKNISYLQTSNAQPTTPIRYFVAGVVNSTVANDLTGGTVTNNSSGASFSMSVSDPNDLFYRADYTSLALMNVAVPEGSTDAFSVSSNSQGTLSDTLNQATASLFTSNIPYVTNFSQLQGMNPSQAFTVDFPSTQPVAGANVSTVFFSIPGTSVISSGGLDDSATSFVIPANALQPNTAYTFELDYSNRLDATATGGFSGALADAGYDVRTDGSFITGPASVPEPASLALLGTAALALFGVSSVARKRRTIDA